jgi:hypothetical protein
MAIRAYQDALPSLTADVLDRARNAAMCNSERLGLWIHVVEFKGGEAAAVAT